MTAPHPYMQWEASPPHYLVAYSQRVPALLYVPRISSCLSTYPRGRVACYYGGRNEKYYKSPLVPPLLALISCLSLPFTVAR